MNVLNNEFSSKACMKSANSLWPGAHPSSVTEQNVPAVEISVENRIGFDNECLELRSPFGKRVYFGLVLHLDDTFFV